MSTSLNENQLKRKNLDEVSFIRPVLIILLVMYHAFAPWCDSWRAFDGFQDVELYWWIGKLSYSFMLPTFVFISGYVWAFQREELNKKDSLTDLAKKKFKRLFIPSIVFGLLYLPLLPGFPFGGGSNLVYTSFLKVIQGTAHMWFLPMLFWCFLICYGILEIANKKVRMCIIALCVALSIIPLPFQFGTSLYYILYFYFGYEMWCRNSQEPINSDKKRILLAWGLFFVCFFILTAIVRCYFETGTNSALVKIISFYMSRICAIVYSISGLYAIYITSLAFVRTRKISKWIINVGSLCFGIYLFQQFILQILYYHTGLPKAIDNIYVPWVGFLIALCLSMAISMLLRKTEFGRKLI